MHILIGILFFIVAAIMDAVVNGNFAWLYKLFEIIFYAVFIFLFMWIVSLF